MLSDSAAADQIIGAGREDHLVAVRVEVNFCECEIKALTEARLDGAPLSPARLLAEVFDQHQAAAVISLRLDEED